MAVSSAQKKVDLTAWMMVIHSAVQMVQMMVIHSAVQMVEKKAGLTAETTAVKKIAQTVVSSAQKKVDCSVVKMVVKSVLSSAQTMEKTKGKCSVETTAVRRQMVESSAHKKLTASGLPTAGKMVVKLVVRTAQKKVDCWEKKCLVEMMVLRTA